MSSYGGKRATDQATEAPEDRADATLIDTARKLLGEISGLSPRWIGAVTLLAFLSTLEVTRTTSGMVEVKFQVTAITAVIVGMAWLPALVRAVVLTGGVVKTPAGEANTRGILELLRSLSAEEKRKVLPPLAFALDSAEATAPSDEERTEARMARHSVERELASSVNAAGQQTEEVLDGFARAYEALRADMKSGPERTFQMGTLMAEVRAFARSIRPTPPAVKERFFRGTEGDRVIALTILETKPLAQCLDEVIDGIDDSQSAFEQFQALRAAEELLPRLGPADRQRLRLSLEGQLQDEGDKGIYEDASRLQPIEFMLARIDEQS